MLYISKSKGENRFTAFIVPVVLMVLVVFSVFIELATIFITITTFSALISIYITFMSTEL